MKSGLYGGTFNPFHNGHLKVITHVQKTFAMDRIHLIPSATPPHKTLSSLASARDRLEMIQRSVARLPGLQASDLEIRRPGPSFTVDTVRQFKAASPPGTALYFILGTDAFFEMDTWKSPHEIFRSVSLIVMTRAGDQRTPEDVAAFLAARLPGPHRFTPETLSVHMAGMKPVYICRTPAIDISSTAIRRRVKNKQPISSLVPPPVEEIIRNKGLYQ